MAQPRLPLAVYYEHPEWFRPLFAEVERRGTPYVRLDAARHRYDPAAPAPGYALLFNRMSAPTCAATPTRSPARARKSRVQESAGVRVVNGSSAFAVETSKAAQVGLLASLGLPHPPRSPNAWPSLKRPASTCSCSSAARRDGEVLRGGD